MPTVLGMDVDAPLLGSWREWIAPDLQPFVVDSADPDLPTPTPLAEMRPELWDTYTLWNVDRSLMVVWLDEPGFFEMPREQRAALVRSQANLGRGAVPAVRRWLDLLDPASLRRQADGHRFVWWPSVIRSDPETILTRFVETNGDHSPSGKLPASQHRTVAAVTWKACATILPGARTLAGTFPSGSGPNCFGTVMAAAGVGGVVDERVLQAPFLDWLHASCRPGGTDLEPGTVMVWFNTDRMPVHAAVTIGDDWALEKPSQCWWTPRRVLNIRDVIRAARSQGDRVHRYRLSSTHH